jgi:hypothetical protein
MVHLDDVDPIVVPVRTDPIDPHDGLVTKAPD